MKPQAAGFFALLILLLPGFAFAVEPKMVGSATISMDLQWILQGDFDGPKMFKTFGFPNTTFQNVSLQANVPFTTEKDDFGNTLLVFNWNERGTKVIEVKAIANVNYDVAPVQADAGDVQKFSKQTQLVLVDDSIATQASLLSQGAKTDFEKLTRFTEWVNNAVAYDDSFWQQQPSSIDVFSQRRGVCNQYSHLDMALLRAAGIPSRFVAGWVYSGKEWAPHAWLEALINGRWVPADATYGEAGWLDATHVVFAYGFDQLDIKEEMTKGLSMQKKQDIEIVSWGKPRDFFDMQVQAPQKVGSSASEKITVLLDNNDAVDRAIPLFLIVPTQPPQLAVSVAGSQKKLVYAPPKSMLQSKWDVLFPRLQENYVYNFTIEVASFGKKSDATVQGEPNLPSPSKEKIVLEKIESVQDDSQVSIIATLTNAGNAGGKATVFISLGNQTQQQSVLLGKGEQKTARFTFSKPLSEKNGEITVSTSAGSSSQPFQIVEAPQQPAVEGTDLQTIGMAAGAVVILLVALSFVRARKEPFKEY